MNFTWTLEIINARNILIRKKLNEIRRYDANIIKILIIFINSNYKLCKIYKKIISEIRKCLKVFDKKLWWAYKLPKQHTKFKTIEKNLTGF